MMMIGPLNQLEGLGSAVSSPSGVRAEPRPKTNLMHSKAVRKPLVAIILNILSTMFYNRTIKI